MLANLTKGYPRLSYHLAMAAFTAFGCVVALMMAAPSQSVLEMLSVGTGYIGLILIAATLLIGPLNMLKVRKNPVNLNFRRDVGIWAGITSLAHVVLAFALELNWGGTLLDFFFYKDGSLKLNVFGISNLAGLAAALVIIFLLVLSNNYFLKKLKGKRWKAMQRFNYLLFAVTIVHTFTQQINNSRGLLLVLGVLAGTGLVLAGQMLGFAIYRQRANSRKVNEPAVRPVAAPATVPANPYLNPSTLPQTRPVPASAAASTTLSPAPGDYSNRQMAAAFGITAVLGVIVGFLGINLLNQANAANNTAAFNNPNPAVSGENNNQNSANNPNNNSANSNGNSNANSNANTPPSSAGGGATSNPFPGNTGRTGGRNRGGFSGGTSGGTTINPPSNNSGTTHTGGS